MKPVFKCEYCNFIGTEEEVIKHEDDCSSNYNRTWKQPRCSLIDEWINKCGTYIQWSILSNKKGAHLTQLTQF